MPRQRTLLDGDTGAKFDSLELKVGEADSSSLPPGDVTGQALVWDGAAWIPSPQNSAFGVRIGRILSPTGFPLLLASGSAVEVAIDPGAGNHFYVSTPDGRLQDTSGNTLFQWVESDGIAFFGQAPTARPSVTGSRGGNAALASLLSALDSLGLIIDSTTA